MCRNEELSVGSLLYAVKVFLWWWLVAIVDTETGRRADCAMSRSALWAAGGCTAEQLVWWTRQLLHSPLDCRHHWTAWSSPLGQSTPPVTSSSYSSIFFLFFFLVFTCQDVPLNIRRTPGTLQLYWVFFNNNNIYLLRHVVKVPDNLFSSSCSHLGNYHSADLELELRTL